MIRIAFIGVNDKRLKKLQEYSEYSIEFINMIGNFNYHKNVIDLFIIQHTSECSEICNYIHQTKIISHIPIICLIENIICIDDDIKSDLIISDSQSDIEFICQVKTLIKMKLTDDELKKEKIVLELNVKDRTNELTNKAERLKVTLNSIGDGVIVTDKNGNITTMNPVALELTELTVNEYLGKKIDNLINIYKSDEKIDIFNIVSKSKKICYIDGDSVLISKTGKKIHISDSASPIFDKNNMMDGIIVVFKDNTTEYQMKSELILEKERAEESDKLKTTFLTNISHEVRTPLNLILGYSQLLTKDSLTKDEKMKYLSIIDNNGKLFIDIIDSIIDLSKIQSNTLKINRENIDINQLLMNSVDEYKKIADDRNKSHLSIEFLNKRENIRLNTDKHKLKQILNNLIVNAIKFTNSGFINYGYYLKNNQVIFYVKDSGRGICNNEKEIIFDRFVKIQNKNDKQIEGMGIGLTITRSFIQMLGGEIWVESDGVRGSNFYFSLPYSLSNNESVIKTASNKYNWHGKKMALSVDNESDFSFYQMVFKIHLIDIFIFDISKIDEYDIIIIHKNNIDIQDYQECLNTGKCILLTNTQYDGCYLSTIKLNDLKDLINFYLK